MGLDSSPPYIPRDEAKKHWCSVRKELGGHLGELVGSHGHGSRAAVSRFSAVTMFMGHFVLTGVAVCHGVRKKKTPTLLSTLGIPRVRRIERTDCDYVRFSVCFVFVFPFVVVSSETENILLFRPNPEETQPRDVQHHEIHSLLVNTVRKL